MKKKNTGHVFLNCGYFSDNNRLIPNAERPYVRTTTDDDHQRYSCVWREVLTSRGGETGLKPLTHAANRRQRRPGGVSGCADPRSAPNAADF